MKKVLLSIITCLFLQTAIVYAEDIPDYVGKYTSTPEDTKAINKVITDFQNAIIEQDSELLISLLAKSGVTFFSPPSSEMLKFVRGEMKKRDKAYDFWEMFNFNRSEGFAKGLSKEGNNLEERFYNVKITQDSNFALVTFDYDFRNNGIVSNYGLEVWQMIKIDDKWYISTVVWSTNMIPRENND